MLLKTKELLNQVNNLSSEMLNKFARTGKPFYRRLWFWLGCGVGGGIIAFHYTIVEIDKTLPDESVLKAMAREQTLTIKAGDGTIIQQQGEATREHLLLKEIPDILQKAFIASEDHRFMEHNGIDGQGILRAVVSNLRSQDLVEGGSTITQQVARILFLKQEKTILRKLKEVRLAQKIEQKLTKDEILERYLNLVYLGSGAYGVADAAWVYFSKPINQLTLSEMATLAGLAPAPNIYAPDKNPQLAIERRNTVLKRMVDAGFITAKEAQKATEEKLNVKSSLPKRLESSFPYFTSYIQQELPKCVKPEVLAAGGLVVETTLNPTWQIAGEKAVAKVLENRGGWQNFTEAALVAINPQNGEIQAMVGGKDFSKNQFNRVTQAKRQPGSTFKGFVYAAAIATGKSPNDSYTDAPLVVDGYEPKNSNDKFLGSLTMTEALTKSVNTIAVKVLIDTGFKPIIKLAHDMGIQSELEPNYSLALGSNEVNLLEITSAYGTFATQGLHTEVHGIRRILNRQGDVIWSAKYEQKRVLDADSAAIMTWMLGHVVTQGTGGEAQLNDRQVAGKTGTTDESRDLWFIGYIPQLVAGVWLGNDNNRPTYGTSSSAAYTWRKFMEKAVEGMEVEKFPERPKLEGRKGTIKAERIKSNKIVNQSVSDSDTSDNNDNNNSDTTPRRRRRRRYYQSENTDSSSYNSYNSSERRSRRRRRYTQDNTNTTSYSSYSSTSSRRKRRYNTEDSNSYTNNTNSFRSRRRRNYDSGSSGNSGNSSAPVNNTPSESSAPKPSWRERLKPGSSSTAD
ncbi:penicillin-binding protein 1A [Anabaena sp. FACHB-1237]|uniref:transglycosylase domain-containing protein n=1 Tax=Anabaena sp. FACHB-1237 TaxID=2692769 RepID=UPI0016800D14|nr:penicillin-binding protein 1A [Anabaena sp. FACHB-1237]MBD2138339.1 penicillin-binding protein 1A [Anabaena sp. FACHB-1237]